MILSNTFAIKVATLAPTKMIVCIMHAMQVAKERRGLETLSLRELNDMGICPKRADVEAKRGFWDF